MTQASFAHKPLLAEKLKGVKALLLDVDGVLTRGDIIYDALGNEIKIFSVKDGLGLRMLMDAGIQAAIVTGRSSPALKARMKNLKITHVWDGIGDKAAELQSISGVLGIRASEMAYMGDDLPDLCLFSRVGVSIAVADAHEVVRDRAMMITRAKGGCGAVREVCEAVLNAQGRMHGILKNFLA